MAQITSDFPLARLKQWGQAWDDPTLVVCVLNNRDLKQVTWEQRVLAGDPRWASSQVLPDFPYARYAEMLGLHGIGVDDPQQVAGAWERALRADRPVVREACTDPNVPPLPRTSASSRPSSSSPPCSRAMPTPARPPGARYASSPSS